MKLTTKQTLAAVALATCALPLASQAQLVISEVYSAGSGNAAYEADWFEVYNSGGSAVDLMGWKVDDSSATFANAVSLRGIASIAPGQAVIFLEGNAAGDNDATINDAFRTAWFGTSVPSGLTLANYGGSAVGLGTGGDGVNVYDAGGTLMSSVSFGAATTGFTFDNAAGLNNSAISQLSAVGVNGAFTAFNGAEVGSPGLVPEPSVLALLGVGGIACLVWRRSKRSAA